MYLLRTDLRGVFIASKPLFCDDSTDGSKETTAQAGKEQAVLAGVTLFGLERLVEGVGYGYIVCASEKEGKESVGLVSRVWRQAGDRDGDEGGIDAREEASLRQPRCKCCRA